MSRGRPRLVTYSHDGFGLGHLRRNLGLVAAVLEQVPDAAVLMVTGSLASGRFPLPPQVDQLKLPSLAKVANDHYVSPRLGLDRGAVTELRSRLIDAAVSSFTPDLLLVDFYPLGVNGELAPTLRRLRDERPGTGVVLGWRDILDEPAQVEREWGEPGHLRAADELFDALLVYGTPDVFDPVAEYGLAPSLAARTRFTGYLLDPASPTWDGGSGGGRHALCTLGGGEDGWAVATAFLGAMDLLRPDGWSGSLVTGPLMPEEQRRALAASSAAAGVSFSAFDGALAARMAAADAVVTMGGYNSVCEVLSTGTPAVVVPRVVPRREQLLRAERLDAAGLVTMLHPDRLDPGTVAGALVDATGRDGHRLRHLAGRRLGTDGRRVAAGLLAGYLGDRLGAGV